MIKTKTVFVIGAGASAEFELPLGYKLAEQIGAALDFSNKSGPPERELVREGLLHNARVNGTSHSMLIGKANEVSMRLATAKSIDSLIHNHSHDEEFALVGKTAIAACLLEAERKSVLAIEKPGANLDLRVVRNTWLAHLFDIMANNVQARSLETLLANVSFVIFNYDRCFEHYLEYAISNRFAVPLNTARDMVGRAAIVHPYGSLGELGPGPAFGQRLYAEETGETVWKMSRSLLTFSESQVAKAEEARTLMRVADHVVFLGFAFHPQNVDLLTVGDECRVGFATGTAFQTSDTSRQAIVDDIIRACGRRACCQLNNLKPVICSQFMLDEQRAIER